MKWYENKVLTSTTKGLLWIGLTFVFGAIQIVITFTLDMLKSVALKTTVQKILSDNSLLFFFQAIVFSLIVEYIFVERYRLKNNLLVFMMFFIPIILLFFSLVLFFAKTYDSAINEDVYYSVELVIIFIASAYSLLVKSVFNYKAVE